MNAILMAERAYATGAQPIKTHRGNEYTAFARVTRKLTDAARKGRKGFPALAEAIAENRQLWTILAMDCADKDNALPKELRAQILYLTEFTLLHSSKVLNRKASVAPLIEINMAILRGLREKGEET